VLSGLNVWCEFGQAGEGTLKRLSFAGSASIASGDVLDGIKNEA
jgi:hypothetical protein